MSSIQSFMKFTNKRIKLDSVADSIGNLDTGVGSTTDLLGCQDEKPIMTFGIADYPSLGFREELGVGGVMGGRSGVGAWDSPLGVLSRFVPGEAGDRSVSSDSGEPSEMDNSEYIIHVGSSFLLPVHVQQPNIHALNTCMFGCVCVCGGGGGGGVSE